MKYINQLTDEELTEIYKSFMAPDDKFVNLYIARFGRIYLSGVIRTPASDKRYADEDGYCKITEHYDITDYEVMSQYHNYRHNKDMSKRLRKFLYKKFGVQYAEDYLFE